VAVTAPGVGGPPDDGRAAAMRRRPWVPRLVALDAVLVAVLLVVVLVVVLHSGGSGSPAPPGGSGSPAPPGGSGTAQGPAPAGALGASPTPTPGPPRFRLPSGNIACDMTADRVTCTIASVTFTPPPVAGCTGTVGHTVVLDATGVSVPCVQGAPPRVAGQDVPMLFYGSTSSVGTYTCTSGTNGVSCVSARGVGFRLARESLTTLP
jgi:hypothetical protein